MSRCLAFGPITATAAVVALLALMPFFASRSLGVADDGSGGMKRTDVEQRIESQLEAGVSRSTAEVDGCRIEIFEAIRDQSQCQSGAQVASVRRAIDLRQAKHVVFSDDERPSLIITTQNVPGEPLDGTDDETLLRVVYQQCDGTITSSAIRGTPAVILLNRDPSSLALDIRRYARRHCEVRLGGD